MAWAVALVAPFVMAILLQALHYNITVLDHLLNSPPFWVKQAVYIAFMLLPSYVVLGISCRSWGSRLRHGGIFFGLTIIYAPALIAFGFVTACALFERCL